jgi:predicted small integral membrane protein
MVVYNHMYISVHHVVQTQWPTNWGLGRKIIRSSQLISTYLQVSTCDRARDVPTCMWVGGIDYLCLASRELPVRMYGRAAYPLVSSFDPHPHCREIAPNFKSVACVVDPSGGDGRPEC